MEFVCIKLENWTVILHNRARALPTQFAQRRGTRTFDLVSQLGLLVERGEHARALEQQLAARRVRLRVVAHVWDALEPHKQTRDRHADSGLLSDIVRVGNERRAARLGQPVALYVVWAAFSESVTRTPSCRVRQIFLTRMRGVRAADCRCFMTERVRQSVRRLQV